jgi:hypothetical protein
MLLLKVLGLISVSVILGAYVILRLIERQANLLFSGVHKIKKKKSKDEELYDEVNPIWKDL